MYYYPPQQMNQYAGAGYQAPSTGLKGHPVSSLEEVRAAQVDFDGSLFIFPDVANKNIYTKQINLDGTASTKVYKLIDNAPATPAYVTKEEFDLAIKNLESTLKERKNYESTTPTNSKPAISF